MVCCHFGYYVFQRTLVCSHFGYHEFQRALVVISLVISYFNVPWFVINSFITYFHVLYSVTIFHIKYYCLCLLSFWLSSISTCLILLSLWLIVHFTLLRSRYSRNMIYTRYVLANNAPNSKVKATLINHVRTCKIKLDNMYSFIKVYIFKKPFPNKYILVLNLDKLFCCYVSKSITQSLMHIWTVAIIFFFLSDSETCMFGVNPSC